MEQLYVYFKFRSFSIFSNFTFIYCIFNKFYKINENFALKLRVITKQKNFVLLITCTTHAYKYSYNTKINKTLSLLFI